MQVRDVMTTDCEYVTPDATLRDAAQRMKKLDCGFMPIGEGKNGKLLGVVTDRDIVVRGIADGKDPERTKVSDIKSDKVLYCFQDDGLVTAAKSMQEQQVHRLVVLKDRNEKKLCGVITLGDIARNQENRLVGDAVSGIAAHAA